jgi:hypothetical protein
MKYTRREHLRLLSGLAGGALLPARAAETDFQNYSDADKERFLRTAMIASAEEIDHGVTKPVKAKLVLSGVEHSAQIQTVDKELPDFFPQKGPPVPMRDSWRFNVAAYKVDRLLGLNMVTVTIARSYKGKPGAISWWVDNVMFEEHERVKKEIAPPDPEAFARQRALGQVFDELIINIDRNFGNLLITKAWKVALIDHTRSFTAYHGIRNEENLTRCSRDLIAKMKAMTATTLGAAVGTHLTSAEERALLARRDRIVEFFERTAKAKGEENVLFP